MSAETFKILNLQEKDLDRSNVPQVVGAEGTSLGAIGTIECELKIGKETCKQTFLVCQNLRRNLILGVDFAKTYAVRGLLVAVGRCNTQVRLSLTYVPGQTS